VGDWPLPRPRTWLELVNTPQTDAELDAIRAAIRRGRPLGSEQWQKHIAKWLGLESTLRPRGRPRKQSCVPFNYLRQKTMYAPFFCETI
jgi:putative transposase